MRPRFKAGDLLYEPTNEETAKLPPFLILGYDAVCAIDKENPVEFYPGYLVLEDEQIMVFMAEYVDKNCEKMTWQI